MKLYPLSRRAALALSLSACAAALLAGCRHKDSEGPEGVKMGLALADASSPYGQAIQRGVEEVAKKRKFEVVLKDARNSAEAQAADLDALAGAGVSVIIVQPVKGESLKAPAKKAADAKAYLVALERNIPDADVPTFVEFNPELAGQLAADFCGFRLKSGSVAIIKGANTPGEAERVKAFKAYLKEKHPGVKVIGEETAADDAAAKAATSRLVAAHPDLGAIFANSDAYGLAAVQAVSGGAKAPFVVSYGGGPEAVAELQKPNSPLQMTLATIPARLGTVSAKAAWSIVCNKPAPSHAGLILLPVTRETAGEYKGWNVEPPKNPKVPWTSELALEGKRE